MAMGLANKAGAGQGRQQAFQNDIQFAQYIRGAQNDEDRKAATEISQALQAQNIGADNARYDQQFAAQQQYQTANLDLRRVGEANDQAQAAASLAARETGLNLREQQYAQKQNAISQLDPAAQAVVQATGRMPYVPNGPTVDQRDMQVLQAEARRLQAEMAVEQKRQAAFSYDPKDLLGQRSEQSPTIPGAAKGLESQYQAAAQALAAKQARLQSLDDALNSRASGMINGQRPQVNQQVLQQVAAQGGVGAVQAGNRDAQQHAGQIGPNGLPVPGSRGVITPDVAAAYLRRVGGPQHMAEAKDAARQDGWIVP